MKKGQGLPLNVIIIAAVALVVLVVLVIVFTGKFRGFAGGVRGCTEQGGSCEELCEDNEKEFSAGACQSEGQICCLDIYDDISDNTE